MGSPLLPLLLPLPLLLLPSLALASFSCKDQHNFDVPWFAAYKMPKMDGEAPGTDEGHGFYYLDSSDRSKLRVSPVSIDQEHQAIGYTLAQFYANKDKESVLHVLYNDEPAMLFPKNNNRTDPKAVETGHTKGVVLFDGNKGTGVWLIHSVPKFPLEMAYEYPDTGRTYAQTFLCLTIAAEDLATVGKALFYNHPDVYSSSSPDWLASASPELVQVIMGQYNEDLFNPSVHTDIKVQGQQSNPPPMHLFAKNHLFEKDLWEDLIAPQYGAMEVETWRRGSTIDLDCFSDNPVYDAKKMQVGDTSFSYSKDHSKHGRTMKQSGGRVCIGDINRMTTQFKRGGGAVCIQDDALWKAWAVFDEINDCGLLKKY